MAVTLGGCGGQPSGHDDAVSASVRALGVDGYRVAASPSSTLISLVRGERTIGGLRIERTSDVSRVLELRDAKNTLLSRTELTVESEPPFQVFPVDGALFSELLRDPALTQVFAAYEIEVRRDALERAKPALDPSAFATCNTVCNLVSCSISDLGSQPWTGGAYNDIPPVWMDTPQGASSCIAATPCKSGCTRWNSPWGMGYSCFALSTVADIYAQSGTPSCPATTCAPGTDNIHNIRSCWDPGACSGQITVTCSGGGGGGNCPGGNADGYCDVYGGECASNCPSDCTHGENCQ